MFPSSAKGMLGDVTVVPCAGLPLLGVRFKTFKTSVAYSKLLLSVTAYTRRQASAHCICSVGNLSEFDPETSITSNSTGVPFIGTVCLYRRSVFEWYSPMYLLVRYLTMRADFPTLELPMTAIRTRGTLARSSLMFLLYNLTRKREDN